MSKRNWTPQQEKAIKTKYRKNGESCNLLVGAAAGSGKTAVLVERVIQKIIPENIENGIDIDKLLIVTFTNAAAREMAERIGKALSGALDAAVLAGDTVRKNAIRRQQLLLSVSEITTIDAFCLKLLRSHFNTLGIEPDFSIADEAQAQILSEEAMEELFSELYAANDKEFLDLLCLYATSRSDDGLADLVRHIYSFTRSIPNPMEWLHKKVEDLKCEGGITEAEWFKKGFADCMALADSALADCEKGLEIICEAPVTKEFIDENPPEKGSPIYDEWKSYYKAFRSDYEILSALVGADFETASRLLGDFSFSSLARLDSKTDEEKDCFKALRQKVKDAVYTIKNFTSASLADIEQQSREKLYPVALSLARLVKKYDELYMSKKLAKNILEFHDTEQLTAQLLSQNPEIAKELQDKYEEILMDEYQDTSLLQEEIFRHVTDGHNLFMVGDMKQSIYRFRSSDPTIFKSKSDTYSREDDAENLQIILSKNFRSRKEVLESINDIFKAIMTESAGELDYDSDQYLYCGNTSYEDTGKEHTSECFVIEAPPTDREDDDEEDMTNHALEARLVAREINRLKAEHFKVLDGGKYRDIENRDIVILMSSYKAAAESYTAELTAAGIECFAERSGYFERSEIRLMTALFKVINNPYCDIPLLGVLRSPIGTFSDDELVVIRKCKKGKFFGAMKELIRLADSGELFEEEQIQIAKKAKAFCEKLKRWRRYARFMSSDRLVWTLYEETDFYAFAGAMHGGEEAQANLRLLFERAKQYENNGFQGLFNFIKYIERIKQKDTDLSSALSVGEGHNVVRIMTIHKSKGLEFPVVFITGGGKRFNKRTSDSRLMLHKDYGIAMDYIDFENSYRTETPAKAVFKSVFNAEQMSEEIRKLYVAATRAREKLYFVATVSGNTDKTGKSGLERMVDKWNSFIADGAPALSPNDVLSASGFADWVCPVAMTSPNWNFNTVKYNEISYQQSCKADSPQEVESRIDISRILEFVYPYRDASSLPSKVSVSDLKASRQTAINPLPEFMKQKAPDGAYYGTAMHKALQLINPAENMDETYIQCQLDSLVLQKMMSQAEADILSPAKILDFYRSDIGKRITSAEKVFREQPFEVMLPADCLFPDINNSGGDSIILQGVIDCFFEEDGELVLVDYKTDRYRDVSEIHEKYDRQLELYSLALKKITKKNVKEKFIYLFFDDNVLQCY